MTDTATDVETASPGRFDSLRIPEYRLLWWGGMCAFGAGQITLIARGWLAFDLTGTNTALGAVLIGFGISSLVAIPIGGLLADRLPKRTVIQAAQMAQTLTAATIATMVATDLIQFWMLIAASMVQGAAISVLAPSRLALIADIVERDRLTNALFLSSMSVQVTRVIGPAAAGALIGVAAFGVSGVYYLGAAISFVAVLLTIRLPLGEPHRRSTRSPWEDIVDGLRYVRRRPELVRLLVVSLVVVMVGFPYVAFLPVMSEEIFGQGASGFGIMNTVAAVGAVVATLSLANLGRDKLAAYQSGAGFLFGVSLVFLGVSPVFVVALVAMLAVGSTSMTFQTLNNSAVLSLADVEYHGRVQSLLMFSFSGFGLAALPLGMLADALGLREILVGMGVFIVVFMAGAEVWRRRLAPTRLPSV
ncbi:MAG: MFS transporter [Acidimicrobiia bacterium]|nr:MFS transporter [Acidimicrobiia bacterium]